MYNYRVFLPYHLGSAPQDGQFFLLAALATHASQKMCRSAQSGGLGTCLEHFQALLGLVSPLTSFEQPGAAHGCVEKTQFECTHGKYV